MRLDIGPDGKIIGTRRVSPNGQVSGLSEFTGREVLVILPGTSEGSPTSPWPGSEEFTRLVGEQVRQAYDRYRVLQETYATPWEATRSFMEAIFGGRAPDLMAEVDRWVKNQVREASRGRPDGPSDASDEPSGKRGGQSGRSDPPTTGTSGRKRP
ncbi:MAG: hypothetical protein L3J97_00705 [Thermoplasmata archaeon]|nr:hypothetical protein [Thermoplasmata archaeon]